MKPDLRPKVPTRTGDDASTSCGAPGARRRWDIDLGTSGIGSATFFVSPSAELVVGVEILQRAVSISGLAVPAAAFFSLAALVFLDRPSKDEIIIRVAPND